MIAAAVMLSAAGLVSATHQGDVVSTERQAKSAHHAIETSIDDLALQQEAVAIWDDAAAHLVASRRDMTWIHDNMGSWLYRLFRHNEVFILDGFDEPLYAATAGEAVSTERYQTIKTDLQFLVDGVRGRREGHRGKHDRAPGLSTVRDSTVRTTARATHESHLVLVGGRPAVASAMLVQPSTEGYVAPIGNWPVLISVRYLDESFLGDLSERQLLASPRISRWSTTATGEHAVPLLTEAGERIAYFIWKPELPGTRIAYRLVPWSLVIVGALAILITWLARRLRKAVRDAALAANQAQHMATHDALTGLPNRVVLQTRFENLTVGRTRQTFALVLIDVDDFKITNDTLGHDAGDAVLKTFADRLRSVARTGDIVARLGGDEFGMLVDGISEPKQLEIFSSELLGLLGKPFAYQGKLIDCQASVGASIYNGKDEPHELLKQADLALYASKAAGRGTYRLYNPSMTLRMRVRHKMIALAKAAIDGEFVEPYYQPKVDLRSGKVCGFEALLRCCPPEEPIYGPRRISAALEDAAVSAQLSDRLLSKVVADMRSWRMAGLDFGHVAINASAADLRRPEYARYLLEKLETADLETRDIQLEVTESVLLGRTATHVRRTLEILHRKGVQIALDDFGTGYASLSHLKQFPVDVIKIDRAFVRNLQVDEHDGAIVHALIELAKALRLEVVAEGIETTAQRDFLRALGCSTAQGHLFGKAKASSSVPNMLNRSLNSALAAA